jgi:hypothetical protein
MLTGVRRRALAYPTVFGHTRNSLGAGAEPGVCSPAASQRKNEPELVDTSTPSSAQKIHGADVNKPTKQCATSLKTVSVLKILVSRTWGRALSEMPGSS